MKHINNIHPQSQTAVLNKGVALWQFFMGTLIPLIVITLVLLANTVSAQYSITEVITDYGGYWKSGATAINPVKPDNSHNLLAFSYNGVRYSTGVNDANLTAHGTTFVAGDYRGLPVTSISGSVTSNTKIGLGEKYDGVTNGKSNPSPANNMQTYLTDGIKGLDIGTCVANLPASILSFAVSNVSLASINDNVPDVVITQTADVTSANIDRYEFTDINGVRVGNYVDIALVNIPAVGNWVADFYEASVSPMTLGSGYTKTERGLRLWTADFSVFGINASNISRIAYFRIILNGNSDVAFVAYNSNALSVNLILPTKLTSFTGKRSADGIRLNWQTVSENNTSKFIVERSLDGSLYTNIGTVNAAGNSNTRLNYDFLAPDWDGRSLYRLKMLDLDGKISYSSVISVNTNAAANTQMTAYPNPAKTFTTIRHPQTAANNNIKLYNTNGILVNQVKATNNETRLDLTTLAKGTYYAIMTTPAGSMATSLIVQ